MNEVKTEISIPIIDLHKQSALQELSIDSNVTLRPMVIEDASGILAILEADPSIRDRVSAAAGMMDIEGVQREIDEYQADSGLIRYIIHNSDKVAGLVSLWRDDGFFGQDAQPYTLGFGYFLDPAERGKGLVTSAVKRLMDVSASCFRVDSFIAFCEDDNRQSISVLTKLGFLPTDQTFQEPSHGWTERKYEKKVNND